MILRGSVVEPRTSEDIAQIANGLRQSSARSNNIWFPIVHFVEELVGDGFQVLSPEEMGLNEGLTFPDQGIVQIREDIYLAACNDDGHARDTLAHELGHFILHKGLKLARTGSRNTVPRKIEDSEWQADEFAGLLLAPTHIISGRTAADISRCCGLSMRVALYRSQKAKNR